MSKYTIKIRLLHESQMFMADLYEGNDFICSAVGKRKKDTIEGVKAKGMRLIKNKEEIINLDSLD